MTSADPKSITDIIVAISTALSVVLAVVIYVLQARRERFQKGVELMLKFSEQFDGEQMRIDRRAAGAGFIKGDKNCAEDVTDFLDTVGLCVRKGAIDRKLVWHTFFYWINNYRFATKSYVDNARTKDKTVWEDFVWLHEELSTLEAKNRGCSVTDIFPTPNDLAHFAKSESGLP